MNKFSALGCGVVAGLSLYANPALAGDDEPHRPRLEGAWKAQTTLRVNLPDCTTSPIIGFGFNPFPTLNTFHRGGTMSEYGTRSPPSTRTAGHGVWKRTGPRAYEYRAVFFTFDPSQLFAGTIEFRTSVSLAQDGDSYEGIGRVLFTDLSGNEIRFCATMSGERISL